MSKQIYRFVLCFFLSLLAECDKRWIHLSTSFAEELRGISNKYVVVQNKYKFYFGEVKKLFWIGKISLKRES